MAILRTARDALRDHWPLYLMEGGGLSLFMISACVVVVLLEHPASVLRQLLQSDFLRRALVGLAMGATAIAIIYSAWGKRSGAHLNPAVTLTFWRLGKIAAWDALFYVCAQFAGALLGILLCAALAPEGIVSDPSVNYVVTKPGEYGALIAFACEILISFGMMLMVLIVSNRPQVNRYTGLIAGAMVALYITIEAPYSGMSMNPARTLGSALPAGMFDALWIYFAGPLTGMMLAGAIYTRGRRAVLCCKLHHENPYDCIFHCKYPHSVESPGSN